MMLQNIAIIILFLMALGYIAYKVSRQFTARGCDKGCGGACNHISLPNNTK